MTLDAARTSRPWKELHRPNWVKLYLQLFLGPVAFAILLVVLAEVTKPGALGAWAHQLTRLGLVCRLAPCVLLLVALCGGDLFQAKRELRTFRKFEAALDGRLAAFGLPRPIAMYASGLVGIAWVDSPEALEVHAHLERKEATALAVTILGHFELTEKSLPEWITFPRADLLLAAEARGARWEGRTEWLLRDQPAKAVAVRASTIEEAVELVLVSAVPLWRERQAKKS